MKKEDRPSDRKVDFILILNVSERGEILQIVTQNKQWLSKIASEGICFYVQQPS